MKMFVEVVILQDQRILALQPATLQSMVGGGGGTPRELKGPRVLNLGPVTKAAGMELKRWNAEVNGRLLLHMHCCCTPSPLWVWGGAWHLQGRWDGSRPGPQRGPLLGIQVRGRWECVFSFAIVKNYIRKN
jgi:hypothetical protein